MPHAPMSRIFVMPLKAVLFADESIVYDAEQAPVVSRYAGDHQEKISAIVRAVNSHDALLAAAEAAKDHLVNDLEEPGRTVLRKLLEAISHAEKTP